MNAQDLLNRAIEEIDDPELRKKVEAAKEELRNDVRAAELSAYRWLDVMKSKPLPFVLCAILGFIIGWFANA